MQNYIWIVLIIFVIAIVTYLKSTKPHEEESEGDERFLMGMGGIYQGKTFPIGKEVVIGRDSNHCTIIYPNGAKGISSVHCKVRVENDKVALVDLASTYGTFRDNGEKLLPDTVYYLETGDGFYIGERENTFFIQ